MLIRIIPAAYANSIELNRKFGVGPEMGDVVVVVKFGCRGEKKLLLAVAVAVVAFASD